MSEKRKMHVCYKRLKKMEGFQNEIFRVFADYCA